MSDRASKTQCMPNQTRLRPFSKVVFHRPPLDASATIALATLGRGAEVLLKCAPGALRGIFALVHKP